MQMNLILAASSTIIRLVVPFCWEESATLCQNSEVQTGRFLEFNKILTVSLILESTGSLDGLCCFATYTE